MRLAFFVDQVFRRHGSAISTDESYILFPASFVDDFEQIVFIGRESRDREPAPYLIDDPRISLLSLPYYPNLYQLWRASPSIYGQIRRTVAEYAAGWDAIIISGPHPIGQMIARQCAALGVVVIPLVRQNLVEQMAAHGSPLMRSISMAAASLLEWDFRRMSRDRLVLTVGAEMTEAYEAHSPRVHNHFPCLVDDEKFQRFSTLRGGADPKRLLCVCRLAPEKGHRFLFDALKKLNNDGLMCHLDVVGDGELEAELKEYVSSAGLAKQVVFHGYVAYGSTLFDLYESAGIMVLPSLTEGFPQVINESLSVGLPTITSAVGGIPSFLSQRQTGILVPPGDVSALADAIAGLVRDGGLRESLRRNGRDLMRANTLEANRAGVLRAIRDEVEFARRPPAKDEPNILSTTGWRRT